MPGTPGEAGELGDLEERYRRFAPQRRERAVTPVVVPFPELECSEVDVGEWDIGRWGPFLRCAIPAGLTVIVITDLPVNTSVAPAPAKSYRCQPAS